MDMFSDSTMQLTLSFSVVSKNNIHNYMKELLKYTFLFNYISV